MSKQEKRERANTLWLIALVTSAFSGALFVFTVMFNNALTQSWLTVAWGGLSAIACVTCMVRETMHQRG